MNEMNETLDNLRAEVLAEVLRDLTASMPGVDWANVVDRTNLPSVEPEPTEPVELIDQVLTVRRTLEAFDAEVRSCRQGTVSGSAIARFVGRLTEDEIIGLSVEGAAEEVADLALPDLSISTRTVIARGLQRAAGNLLNLSLDLAFASGLQFTINDIDEIEFTGTDQP